MTVGRRLQVSLQPYLTGEVDGRKGEGFQAAAHSVARSLFTHSSVGAFTLYAPTPYSAHFYLQVLRIDADLAG